MKTAVTVRLDENQMTTVRVMAAIARCSLAEVLRDLVQERVEGAANKELLEVWRSYFEAVV